MSDLLPFLVLGAASGSLYGLAGLGLVLTYRTSGVFNFGHGAIAAAAAFLFNELWDVHGVPWPVAAAVVLGTFALIGRFLLEPLTRTLLQAPPVVPILFTIGLFLGIQGLLFVQFGTITRFVPHFLPESGFEVSGVLISWAQVISVVIGLGAAVGLYVYLRWSWMGVAMRGVVDNSTLIGLTGEAPARIRGTAWAIGAVFAAASGILLAPTLGLDPTLLTFLVVQAFGACAVGRFKSLPLTYLGGVLIGVVAAVATKYFTTNPWSGLPSSVPFIVLILVLLLVRPSSLPNPGAGAFTLSSEPRRLPRPTLLGVGSVGATALIAIPFVVGNYLPVWTNALSYVILFASLSLLVWTSGQISLCHMAFVAIGATTLVNLTDAGVPWVLALILSGVAAAPIGVLLALPAIRLSGVYLALLTLGFGILLQNVVYQTSFMFGQGLTVATDRPSVFGAELTTDRAIYFLMLACAVLTCAVLLVVQRGQLGRLLRAMSTNPTMLSTHGLAVSVTRVIVFAIAAFFAAVAGALQVSQYGGASGQSFGPGQSLIIVAVLAMCGTRLVASSVIAALLMAVVPAYVTEFDLSYQLLAFGVAAIVASMVLASMPRLRVRLSAAIGATEGRRAFGPVRARMRGSAPKTSGHMPMAELQP